MLMPWLVLWVICTLKAGLCRTTYRIPITISWVKRTQNIQRRDVYKRQVVIRKGVGRKSKRNVVVVEMRTPAGKNSYGTIEATFYAENVFTTPAAKNARNILKKYGIEDAESFYKFIERDDVTGCDWIRFLIEKGFLFNE